jgi:hypothetical protein
MATLPGLLQQYPILQSLSSFISTVDLHNVSLTSHACRAPIERSFKSLKRNCLCDGKGLELRQTFMSPYAQNTYNGGSCHTDEPIEVRLWNTTCDATEALPCVKCGVNVCEECRIYSREALLNNSFIVRRPHVFGANVHCLCTKCDDKLKEELEHSFFLNALCDCDRLRRWICYACAKEEHRFDQQYYQDRTILLRARWDELDRLQTKIVVDNYGGRAVCKAPVLHARTDGSETDAASSLVLLSVRRQCSTEYDFPLFMVQAAPFAGGGLGGRE